MFNFKTPEISDYDWAKEALKSKGPVGSEKGFATIYLWHHAFGTTISNYHDDLVIRYVDDEYFAYVLPLKSNNARELIDLAMEDAKTSNKKIMISDLYEDTIAILEKEYPNRFKIIETDYLHDYIYTAEKLAALPGRKLHRKRNHLTKFKRLYPDYQVFPLSKNDAPLVMEILNQWITENDYPQDYEAEQTAIKRAMENFDTLGLCGAYITIENVPVSFVIAEKLNEETLDLHFEKALGKYDGLYAAINNEFAKMMLGKFTYLNREEDLGLEGLRKAKQSYYPDILLKKYAAVLKEDENEF